MVESVSKRGEPPAERKLPLGSAGIVQLRLTEVMITLSGWLPTAVAIVPLILIGVWSTMAKTKKTRRKPKSPKKLSQKKKKS